MHGVKRVIIFCLLIAFLPISLLIVPLYLRHYLYQDVVYAVTESDVLEVDNGVSTIFCSAHTLHMNETFNAFQMGHRPEITSYRKHIRLKKSMTLPDDTLEYWGFYLLTGASVALSVCSRFPGASILVVKGERTLRTCGMLEHNQNKAHSKGVFLPEARDQVKITFETNAQEVESQEYSVIHSPPTKFSQEKNHLSNMHNNYIKVNNTRKLKHTKRHFRNNRHNKNVTKGDYVDRKKNVEKQMALQLLREKLNIPGSNTAEEEYDTEYELKDRETNIRMKRNQEPVKPPALLDQGIKHGGNALKNLTGDSDSSVSSFEEGLLNCYEGQVLLAQEFEPSNLCINVSYLENGKYMQTHHHVTEDGYYYYIFYSDNDFVFNDIHAVFDIYKPTFQYENVTKSCINQTECIFPLSILSSDRIIVEVPTKDGIEHEQDDISLLISVCHPRMGMYIIFPVAILFLIISCAFL
ncbi:uncharacterized protein [Chelonus insularis]|uniref:uncharacterized protein n=1 Tax=Chelonus insularis TaxID=460826 RepID=UPI00158EA0EF|nr:uncharacterized protein LOC118074078 [Chelonus insularis]XP_034950882.1 uncharacterized protein LOC118074078 [Chelonus insularis]